MWRISFVVKTMRPCGWSTKHPALRTPAAAPPTVRQTDGMRIFISSTRKGLEEERDAVPGLIKALGHEPLLFEQFTAQPVPSRQACMDAVASADAYMLLLGGAYGYVWPDSGLSATHEEYRAAQARGIRRGAFRKLEVDVEPAQREFIDEVEAYPSGLFRASFTTTAELLTAATGFVRDLEQVQPTLTWRALPEPISVGWRSDRHDGTQARYGGRHLFEVYVLTGRSRTAGQLRDDAARIANVLRSTNVVGHSTALDLQANDETASVDVVDPPQTGARGWNRAEPGRLQRVELSRSGQVCVIRTVPRDTMGALVDERWLSEAVAEALLLVGQLGVAQELEEVALAAEVRPLDMLVEGDPAILGSRNSASMPTRGRQTVRVPARDMVSVAALTDGASEAGRELAVAVIGALRRSQ